MSTLGAILNHYRLEVEAEMRAVLDESQRGRTPRFYDMMRYHLGWADAEGHPAAVETGKRLRPIFCLLACEAAGGRWEIALPAAAALEILHNFSLVHDDIQDRSDERHHRPTVWRLWGAAQAINVGDALHVLARLALLRLDGKVEPWLALAAARALDEACLRLCEGQYLDLSFQDRLDVAVEEYLTMIGGKTAALLAASLELGALLGGAAPDLAAGYHEFGRELGLAFQMKDDELGIWGEPEVTGKPAADDIREKKKSLPVVYALEQAPEPQRTELRRLYGLPALGPAEITAVLGVLDAVGSRAFTRSLAERHYEAARIALERLPVSSAGEPARLHLQELAEFVVQREY